MPSAEHVRSRIAAAIPDSLVDVVDTTGGGDHFRAVVVSSRFEGLSRVEQHRLVYDAVQSELADGSIHALSLSTRIPAKEKS